MSRRRTTGSGGTSSSTSGSRAAGGFEWRTSRAARDTDRRCSRKRPRTWWIDANPEAHEHARLRYRRPNLRFERGLIEDFEGPCDALVFLQTIEHVADPDALLARLAGTAPIAYVSTPNRLTLAPPGAEKSDNPWHVREYTLDEYRALLEPHYAGVEILGVFHARKLRAHELALRAGWDRVHAGLGITRPFYDRFVPAISSTDFALRDTPAGQRPRLPGYLSCVRQGTWRSCCTRTCPTSRASGRIRSARSGCSTPTRAPTCRCSRWHTT